MWGHLSNVIESITNSRAKKLSRLFLRVQYITPQNVGEIREILAALADRQHPFSKQLRTFGFWAADVPYEDSIVDAEIYSHALHMVDENKTLHLFRLQLPVLVQTKEESTALKEAFDRHQHQVLTVEANPLGIREKAAFLSVMKAKNVPLAMRALDRGVINTILNFAPLPYVRCVNFEPPRVADRR